MINNANNTSHQAEFNKRRLLLWATSKSITFNTRHKKCGQSLIGFLLFRMSKGQIFSKGLHTCGSVWICAWCTAKHRFERNLQIKEIIEAFQTRIAGQMLLQTFTVSHSPNMPLKKLLVNYSSAWKFFNQGDAATKEKQTYSQFGFIKALEIRYSRKSGWNVHVHVVRMLSSFLSPNDISAWHTNCVKRWTAALTKAGLPKPSKSAQDIRVLTQTPGLSSRMADYLTKQVTVPFFKETAPKDGSRSAWNILEDYSAHKHSGDAALWREFELATKGHRQLQTSSNLRKNLGVQDPYAVSTENVEFIDICFSENGIQDLVKRPELRSAAHSVYKKYGLDSLCTWLEERGIEYELKTGTTNQVNEDELVMDWIEV